MQLKDSVALLSTCLLLLLAKESRAEFQCYVCDHCPSITPNTPVESCDADYFSSGGTELPSTMTTTSTMTTEVETTTTTSTLATEPPTTTELPTEADDTTTEMSDETTMMTESTEMPIPTPATVGPAETTTAMPTPPIIGTEPNMMLAEPLNEGINMNATTPRAYMNSSMFRVRQLRHVVQDDYSYHCYTVRLTVTANNTVNTKRGCARVTTDESVCGQLELNAGNETSISKCQYCTESRCNGSSTLGVSIVAMCIGLLVAFVKRA